MFDVQETTLTRFANQSPITFTGAVSYTTKPIMCVAAADAAAFVGKAVVSGVVSYGVGVLADKIVSQAGDDVDQDCTDVAAEFATSALYVSPTRLAGPAATTVDPNAGVEQLIQARRTSNVLS